MHDAIAVLRDQVGRLDSGETRRLLTDVIDAAVDGDFSVGQNGAGNGGLRLQARLDELARVVDRGVANPPRNGIDHAPSPASEVSSS